ncbi:MAG: DNA adenine methylase [Clostridia bacterium]|nr:DNA adenine methylase [Clostridia bacterium]
MNSFIGWIGGKRALRDEIIACFPSEFERYIEVFGGAGWVLFRKDKSKFEVFNDADGDLINLYRQIKCNYNELQREIDKIHSRELFDDYKQLLKTSEITDLQRAAMYYYLIKHSFGNNRYSFATCVRHSSVNEFANVAERLIDVIIENQDFEKIIKTYDRDNALFYCDPPYVDTEKYYKGKFTFDDHVRLKNVLSAIKGKFILSYNDCDIIRELYKDYNIIGLTRMNTLQGNTNSNLFKEVLITNY